LDIQYEDASDIDLTGTDIDRSWLDHLPPSPGIYRIYDSEEILLYVGKAARLCDRVNHYFRRAYQRDEREMRIIERAHRVEIEECGSELMALVLEEREIREKKPLLNVQRQVFPRNRRPRRAGNLAILLPAVEDGEADIVFHHPPLPLRILRIPLEGPLPTKMEREVRDHLRRAVAATPEATAVAPTSPTSSRPVGEPQAVELEIASGWIELNRDRLLAVDLDAVRDDDHALRLLLTARSDLPSYVEGVDYR
jgi:hypothetical protein